MTAILHQDVRAEDALTAIDRRHCPPLESQARPVGFPVPSKDEGLRTVVTQVGPTWRVIIETVDTTSNKVSSSTGPPQVVVSNDGSYYVC